MQDIPLLATVNLRVLLTCNINLGNWSSLGIGVFFFFLAFYQSRDSTLTFSGAMKVRPTVIFFVRTLP